jgi:hypothetical protein
MRFFEADVGSVVGDVFPGVELAEVEPELAVAGAQAVLPVWVGNDDRRRRCVRAGVGGVVEPPA